MADDHTLSVTPNYFIKKWGQSQLKERSSAQEHFLDLCHLLGESTPAEIDPRGEFYCFERGAAKEGGGDGWPADVSDDDIPARLFALNQARAEKGE